MSAGSARNGTDVLVVGAGHAGCEAGLAATTEVRMPVSPSTSPVMSTILACELRQADTT